MAGSSEDGVGVVEFLADENLGPTGGERTSVRAIASGSIAFLARRRLVAELVAAAGAAGTVISVFLPQLVLRFHGVRAVYTVNGLGHYRVVVADPRFAMGGAAPPLGFVALPAGVLLLLVLLCANWLGPRRVDALTGVLAGVLAGAFACSSVEATGWPDSSWSYGWWISAASALCALIGAGAAHVGRPRPTPDD